MRVFCYVCQSSGLALKGIPRVPSDKHLGVAIKATNKMDLVLVVYNYY